MVQKVSYLRVYTFRLLIFGLLPVLLLFVRKFHSGDVSQQLHYRIRGLVVNELIAISGQQLHQSAVVVDNNNNNNNIPVLPADSLDEKAVIYRLSNTTVNDSLTYDRNILGYLSCENNVCKKNLKRINDSTSNYCPCVSPHLRGRISVNTSTDFSWSDIGQYITGKAGEGGNGVEWGGVLPGGEWKPSWCTATTRLAVVIPFRDRDSHLRVFLRHIIPVLQRQLVHFRIFVTEQKSPSIFNKAAVMNIGFLEASRLFPDMNCVIFHDVDTLVEDDRTLMRCSSTRTPTHYAYVLKRWGYRMLYGGLFGGAISMQPGMFRRINGFPLVYFGWGGVDDDMGTRIRRFYRVIRPPMVLGRYTTLGHGRDSNPDNRNRHGLLSMQNRRYGQRNFEGLTNLTYNVHLVETRPFYTWVHASLSVDGLPYPEHAAFTYNNSTGACVDNTTFKAPPRDFSLVTCRFLCDVANAKKSQCVGFTYYFLSEAERRLGATVSKCVWLKEKCQLQQQQQQQEQQQEQAATSNVFTFYKVNND